MKFYKIIATHRRTGNRFVYSTLGDYTTRGFFGEQFNPKPLSFSCGVAHTIAHFLQIQGFARLNISQKVTLADYQDYIVTTEEVDA